MLQTALRLALAASIAPSAVALAQCPANQIGGYFGPSGAPIYAASYRDSSCTNVPPPCDQRWRTIWDLAAGDAFCEGHTTCDSEIPIPGDVGLFTADDYVLTGPASPDPISFNAVLHVSGYSTEGCHLDCTCGLGCCTVCSYGSLAASLQEGTQVANAPAASSQNSDLQVALSKSVGQHFQLAMTLRAAPACNAYAQLSSHLTFNLPPGYGIQSCYGYASPAPTAVLRANWGHVKALYR